MPNLDNVLITPRLQVEKKIVEDATHFQSYLGDPEDKGL